MIRRQSSTRKSVDYCRHSPALFIGLTFAAICLIVGAPAVSIAADQAPIDRTAATPMPVNPGRPHASSSDPHRQLSPQKLLQVALQHKNEGRPAEAFRTLTMAINRYPDEGGLYAVRGSLYLETGQYATALQDLERAVALNPDDAAALTNRAQTYRQFGREKEAMQDLERAVEISPNLIPALFNRGALRYSQADLEGAKEDFDRCIAADPHMPAPYFNRAAVFEAMDQRAAAIADIERFISIADNDAWKHQAEELLKVWRQGAQVDREGAKPDSN